MVCVTDNDNDHKVGGLLIKRVFTSLGKDNYIHFSRVNCTGRIYLGTFSITGKCFLLSLSVIKEIGKDGLSVDTLLKKYRRLFPINKIIILTS